MAHEVEQERVQQQVGGAASLYLTRSLKPQGSSGVGEAIPGCLQAGGPKMPSFVAGVVQCALCS